MCLGLVLEWSMSRGLNVGAAVSCTSIIHVMVIGEGFWVLGVGVGKSSNFCCAPPRYSGSPHPTLPLTPTCPVFLPPVRSSNPTALIHAFPIRRLSHDVFHAAHCSLPNPHSFFFINYY